MDGRIQILRAKCFPLKVDTIKDKEIDKWLKALLRENLIILYSVNGKQYLKMATWGNHQQIRAKRHKYPMPDDENSSLLEPDITCNQMISNDCNSPRNPIQSESESESESESNKTAIEIAIEDFKEFRKKIKKPMTDKAVQLLHIELNKFAEDDETKIAILNQSIVNGWQGVFPLKEKDTPQQQMTTAQRKQVELQEALRKADEELRKEGITFE